MMNTSNAPADSLRFNKINTSRRSQLNYFLRKMQDTNDGDGSLLDKTAIIWGSPMADPNLHNQRRAPLLLLGGASGALEGGLHLRAPEGTPMANVFVSLMQKLGHTDMTTFGDSTGEFALDFQGGPAPTGNGARSDK